MKLKQIKRNEAKTKTKITATPNSPTAPESQFCSVRRKILQNKIQQNTCSMKTSRLRRAAELKLKHTGGSFSEHSSEFMWRNKAAPEAFSREQNRGERTSLEPNQRERTEPEQHQRSESATHTDFRLHRHTI